MRSRKKSFDLPVIVLCALILTAVAVNYFWLAWNCQPPVDDEAVHLLSALNYRDILSNPFPDLWARLGRVDHIYPPLFPFLAACFSFFFRQDTTLFFCMTNVLFMAGTFLALYFIGLRLGNRWSGVLASAFLILYPMFFHLNRMFMLEAALTCLVSVTITLLIYSDGFQKRGLSLLAGIAAGLGLLTKQSFIVFLVGPAGFFLCYPLFVKGGAAGWKRKGLNFLLFLALAAAISLPWYLCDAGEKMASAASAAFDNDLVPFTLPAFSFRAWSFYFQILRQEQISGLFLAAFLVALVAAWRNRRVLPVFLVWILLPYFILSLFPNKFYYYTVPFLPAVAFITAFGLLSLSKVPLRRAVIGLILMLGAAQFFYLSFLCLSCPTRIFHSNEYAPRYLQDFQFDAVIGRLREANAGGRVSLGVVYIDGNEVIRKGYDVGDAYILADINTWKYLLKLKGLAWEAVKVRPGPGISGQARPGFIISYLRLEDAGLPPDLRGRYRLSDIFVMPDLSRCYLYELASAAPGKERGGVVTHPGSTRIELDNGALSLVLDTTTWKIFWRDLEITKGLSLYTSLSSRGHWLDSRQFNWRVQRIGGRRLRAVGYSLYRPLCQVWDLALDQGRIGWDVRIFVTGIVPVERVQFNVMLREEYDSWATRRLEGDFPKVFNKDYNGDWQTLARPEAGSADHVRAWAKGGGWPQVTFSSAGGGRGLGGRVVNSDDQFNGRVLQYVREHANGFRMLPGQLERFQGHIDIEDRK